MSDSSPELVITERNGARSFSIEFNPGKSIEPKLGTVVERIKIGPILARMKIDHLRRLYEEGLLGSSPTGQGQAQPAQVGPHPSGKI